MAGTTDRSTRSWLRVVYDVACVAVILTSLYPLWSDRKSEVAPFWLEVSFTVAVVTFVVVYLSIRYLPVFQLPEEYVTARQDRRRWYRKGPPIQ